MQLDGLAMGRVEIGLSPLPLAPAHIPTLDEFLGDAHAFKGVEPMPVIGLSQVRISLGLRRLDFCAQEGTPFRPGEIAGFREAHGHGKRLGFPGFVENRACLVAGQLRKSINRRR